MAPTTAAKKQRIILINVIVFTVVVIFIVDLNIPLGVATGVPYVIVVLATYWIHNTRTTMLVAVLCTLLVIVGFYTSPGTGELWKIISNRLLAIFAIWLTAWFSINSEKDRRKLRISEQRVRVNVENAVIGMITIDGLGIIGDFNSAAEKLFGYTANEVIGQNVKILMPEPYHSEHDQYLDNYKRTGQRKIIGTGREVIARRKDGTTFPADLTVSEAHTDKGRIFAASIQDITDRKLIEEKLLLTQFTLDNSADCIHWIMPDGRLAYVNDSTCNTLGYSREELMSMSVFDINPDYTKEEVWDERWKKIKHEKALFYETHHQAKDGRIIPVEIWANYIKFADKELACTIVRDITDRKLIEEKLLLTQFTLDNSADCFYWIMSDGRLAYVNDSSCNTLGYSREEFMLMSVLDINPNYTKETWDERWKKIKHEKVLFYETHHQAKDGRIIPIEVLANYIKFADKELACTIVRDITDRKLVEEKLLLTQFTLDNAADCVFWIMPDAHHAYVNNSTCNKLGYSREELMSMSVFDINPDYTKEETWEARWKKIKHEKALLYETHHQAKDGRIIPVEIWANYIKFADKELVCTIVRDITERNQLMDEVRIANDRVKLALSSAHIGTWSWNIINNKLVWDDHIHMLYGLEPGTFGGHYEDWFELVHPDDQDRVQGLIDNALVKGEEYNTDYRIIWPDGSMHNIAARGLVYRDENGNLQRMAGACWDITEQKRLQEEVRINNERFNIISEVICSWDRDLQTNSLWWGKGIKLLFGYNVTEVKLEHWSNHIHADDKDRVLASIDDVIESDQGHWVDEYRFLCADNTYAYVHDEGQVIRNEQGEAIRMLGAMINITELNKAKEEIASKEKELRENADQLVRAKEKAEAASVAKARFLANMSHELRTPLNAIIGYSEMLKEDAELGGQTEIIPDLQRIHEAGGHLVALISDILDLSKIEAGRMILLTEIVDIKEMLETIEITMLPLVQKNENKLNVELANDITTIQTDPVRLRQCLINLLSNAAKFTEKGEINLSVLREHQDDKDWLVFKVSDTGIGMDAKQLEHIFHDFTQAEDSTPAQYGGTGLGLAIVRELARMMTGDISVTSEPGKGSTFTLRLPTQVNALQTEFQSNAIMMGQHADVASAEKTEGALVLVVDDDPRVLELMTRQFVKEGYRVLTATDGEQALQLARLHHPMAITLDVLMPGMDGWHVLSALKADPVLETIPVIICTIVDEKDKGFSLGATDYLTKPVDRKRLLELLKSYCTVPPCHVLVVEDDPSSREMVVRMLARTGWFIQQADNGSMALKSIEKQLPDVILLDLMMPEMDGFEFIEKLQQHKEWCKVPVIVVTAKQLSAEDQHRLNGYVTSIINKGKFDSADLLKNISEQLARCISTPVSQDNK